MSIKTEKHFIIKLAFRELADSNNYQYIYISDRNFDAGKLWASSDNPPILGILSEISGFENSMGTASNKINDGTIEIKATRHTLNFARRIYDLLENYLLVNQEIICYALEKKRDAIAAESDLETEFVGTVSSYVIDPQSQKFTLSVRAKNLSDALASKRYALLESSDFYDPAYIFPIANNQNKIAPIVFGESVRVALTPLYTVKRWPLTGIGYGAASRLGTFAGRTTNEPLRLNKIQGLVHYFKNKTNELESVDFSDTTFLYGLQYDGSSVATLNFTNLTPSPDEVYTHYIPLVFGANTTQKIYADILNLRGVGRNDGGLQCEGSIRFELFERSSDWPTVTDDDGDPNRVPIPNTIVELSKADLVSRIQSASKYLFAIKFPQPIILDKDIIYYLKVSETGAPNVLEFGLDLVDVDANNGIEISPGVYDVPPILTEKTSQFDRTLSNIQSGVYNLRSMYFRGYDDARLYDSGTGDLLTGVENANFFDIQISNIETGSSVLTPELRSVFVPDVVTALDGYRDDDAAIISANELFLKSHDVLKLLYYLQNGNSTTGWGSRFSDAEALSENIGGVETREVSYRNLMIAIAEADASAVIINNAGGVDYWTYGSVQPISAVITERNCTLGKIEGSGLDNVVNKITLYYGERISNLSQSDLSNINYENSYTEERADSIALYGTREASGSFITNNWIMDEATAIKYARYKLDTHEFEKFYITVTIPYWHANFRNLKVWDLVELNHIDLPSFYGSLSSNETKNLFDGVDWSVGDALRQSNHYYCRILSRKVNFSLQQEPEIVLELETINKNEIAIGV